MILNSKLSDILEKNHIQFVKEDSEDLAIPEGQQIVLFSPKGKAILAENTMKRSVHYEVAEKINPTGDEKKSLMGLIQRGFIFFADISRDGEHHAALGYLKGKTTKIQHEKLNKIKSKGYTFEDGGISEEELYEMYPELKENMQVESR